jgi:Na+-translocating ferredoxin:NAD+ oxidoreductase RnfG subunit
MVRRLPAAVALSIALASTAVAEGVPRAEPETKSPDGPEHVKVYFTEDEALDKVFPGADSLWTETWEPSAEEIATLERRLGWRVDEREYRIHRGSRDGRPIGYAIITEQVGLYKPITFIVKVSEAGDVESVWVLVYRESRGGEVRRERFLRQYKGRRSDSPLRLNRDIIGVTGATFSARAINAGVKRVLNVIDVRYFRDRR